MSENITPADSKRPRSLPALDPDPAPAQVPTTNRPETRRESQKDSLDKNSHETNRRPTKTDIVADGNTDSDTNSSSLNPAETQDPSKSSNIKPEDNGDNKPPALPQATSAGPHAKSGWAVHPNSMTYLDNDAVKHQIHIPTGTWKRVLQLFIDKNWDELGKFPVYSQQYTEADYYLCDDRLDEDRTWE